MSYCSEDDMLGDCNFNIPFNHKSFLTDSCSVRKNPQWNILDKYEPLFFHNFGEVYLNDEESAYRSSSPDLLIAYMSYLLREGKDETIEVDYSHFYWGIHDMQHALHDEAGCTLYVDGSIEEQRLKDGFEIMVNLGHYPTFDMINNITEEFMARFKFSINLEQYLEF